MKVYRIQCNTYDEDGTSHSFCREFIFQEK